MVNQIHARWPQVSIVFVENTSSYALQAMHVLADGYLVKPVTVDKIRKLQFRNRTNLERGPLMNREDEDACYENYDCI